jgi:two-component system, NarL family, invasion response regulator UvrY
VVRILIADDHALFREGIKQILQKHTDMEVVAEAADGRQALAAAREHAIDVVLLDLSMPGLGGLDILRDLELEHPRVAVLVLSMHPEEQYAVRVLKAGAAGYLTKASAAEDLVAAIRTIARGGTFANPAIARLLAATLRSEWDTLPHHLLSDREFQVMKSLAEGKRICDIAAACNLSEKTITTYRTRVLQKMHLRTNGELTRYALLHRLIA